MSTWQPPLATSAVGGCRVADPSELCVTDTLFIKIASADAELMSTNNKIIPTNLATRFVTAYLSDATSIVDVEMGVNPQQSVQVERR